MKDLWVSLTILGAATLVALASPTCAAATVTFTMPALSGWCTDRIMTIADGSDPAKVDSEREEGVKLLDTALADKAVPTSGLPFVASASEPAPAPPAPPAGSPAAPVAPPAPTTFQFSVCVLVPTGNAAVPAGAIRRVTLPAAIYQGIDCGDFDGRQCIDALRMALITEKGAGAAEKINTSPVILTRRILDVTNSTAIPAAFQSASDRATLSGLTISGSGTPGGLNDPNPKSRPLYVTPQTALQVGGIPVAKNLFAATANP